MQQRALATVTHKLGWFSESGGEQSAAAAYYREAAERNQHLVALDPGNAEWENDRAWVRERLAAVQGNSPSL